MTAAAAAVVMVVVVVVSQSAPVKNRTSTILECCHLSVKM